MMLRWLFQVYRSSEVASCSLDFLRLENQKEFLRFYLVNYFLYKMIAYLALGDFIWSASSVVQLYLMKFHSKYYNHQACFAFRGVFQVR